MTMIGDTSNTLVLLDILALLNLCACIITYKSHTHILLTTTELRSVDSDKQSLDTTLFSMLDISLCDLAIAVDVTNE